MESFTVKTSFKMGEADEKFGQSYWCNVEEMAIPVKFNLMSGSVQEGDRITFEEQLIKKTGPASKHPGSEYRQLKKVKVQEGGPRQITQESVQNNQANAGLEARIKRLEDVVFVKPIDPALDQIVEVEDEEINLNDILF